MGERSRSSSSMETPTGLRKATIHGWTGVTFVANTSTFPAMTARTELDRTGIYLLFGPDPDKAGRMRVYIGSASSVAERIKTSAAQRGFWETAVAITTSDDDLSKGHVKYLEARLIEKAVKAQRAELDNVTQPSGDRRRLPEADQANMEQFLQNIEIILPVVGLGILKPQPKAASSTTQTAEERTRGEVVFEIRHRSGVRAEAVEDEGEFVILEGSQALRNTGLVNNTYAALKGALVRKAFSSPYQKTSTNLQRPSPSVAPLLRRQSCLTATAMGGPSGR